LRRSWAVRPSSGQRDLLWLLGPCVVYLLVFSVFPLLYSLRLSLTNLTASSTSGRWVGLENYREILGDPHFWSAAWNTALMVGFSVAIAMVLGTALALFFSLKLRGSSIVRAIMTLPMLITPIVVGVMWRALLNPDWGIVNWAMAEVHLPPVNWLGSTDWAIRTLVMVDVWQWTPFVFVIVFARLQSLPVEVFEAAQVDGAPRLAQLRWITLPLLAPAIALAAIIRGIDAFRSFDLVYGLSYGGPARASTTLSFLDYQNGFDFQSYGYAAAIAYVMVVILVIATTVLLRLVRVRREDAMQ
jgi:multiple sugar transport system permease protein